MSWIDPYQEAMDDEAGAAYGDPRRCPRHPGIATSSGDGLHDAPCGACEYESEYGESYDERAQRLAAIVPDEDKAERCVVGFPPPCEVCGPLDANGDHATTCSHFLPF